ncbi:hypothetical protein D3C81_1878080 [compost metagenome]
MPQRATFGQGFGRRLASYPAQAAKRQLHPVFLAPGAQALCRQTNRGAHPRQVVGVDPFECRRRIALQQLWIELINVAHAFAGIAET